MVEIFAGISLVNKIIGTITDKQYSNYGEIAGAVLTAASGKDVQLLNTKGSMTKLLAGYIVQPTIIVTNSMKNSQNIDKLIDLHLDVFTAFYMQTFEILKNLYGKDITTIIDVLGTGNGNVIKSVTNAGKFLSGESFDKDYFSELFSCESLSLEDKPESNIYDKTNDSKDSTTSVIVHRSISITTEVPVIVDGKKVMHSIIMPLTIRGRVLFLPVEELVGSLKQNDRTKSLYMRYMDWKAGAISTYNLLFCDDLIKEYKQNKIKNKSELMDLISDQDFSAASKLTYDKMVGFEKYYKLVIMSSDDIHVVNKHMMGNIKNERERQEFLEQLRAMVCTLVDFNYDRCHMYIKDLPGETFFSLKKLSNRKDNNLDLAEIVKTLMMNKPPVL